LQVVDCGGSSRLGKLGEVDIMKCHVAAAVVLVLFMGSTPRADEKAPADIARPAPNRKDEPVAKQFSRARASEFLDGVSVYWTRDHKCGTCHSNFPYLMARPAFFDKGKTAPAYDEVRNFFQERVAGWDGDKEGSKPLTKAEVMATAVVLAFADFQTTGKLHPRTREALDRTWTLQRKDGAWNWDKCGWPPMEHDDYYGAAFIAMGVGIAPDDYARTEKAQTGLARLREYFKNTPPPSLHHQAMLLWASLRLEGLMTREERERTIKDLRSRQRPDGGWSLPSLGDWKRRDGSANSKDAVSDGYATGFVVYILRQAGVAADDPAIQRGVAWLKANQRESGRWFTFSLNNDKAHYISDAGSAYAVLALQACDALKD
jgi:squalene-hopene/tetraprenyl-beta-curcumene cyclase